MHQDDSQLHIIIAFIVFAGAIAAALVGIDASKPHHDHKVGITVDR